MRSSDLPIQAAPVQRSTAGGRIGGEGAEASIIFTLPFPSEGAEASFIPFPFPSEGAEGL